MSQNRRPDIHVATSSPIRVSYRDDLYLIRIQGRLGDSGYLELRHVLAQAEASSATRILLDIDRVSDLDASTLHTILQASRRSIRDGNRLQVTRGNGRVGEIFRLTSLDQTIPFGDDGVGHS